MKELKIHAITIWWVSTNYYLLVLINVLRAGTGAVTRIGNVTLMKPGHTTKICKQNNLCHHAVSCVGEFETKRCDNHNVLED